MGKKRIRKSVRSKGQRRNVATKVDTWSFIDKELFKIRAKAKKKRVCETIPNPNKEETNRLFIRVCTNG